MSSHTAAIVLTFNEELHIARAIESARAIADRVYVIDAHSTDKTVELAYAMGATVLRRRWSTHAIQFNWALSQLPEDTDWVFRLDADEYVDERLVADFKLKKSLHYSGLAFSREVYFCGARVRYGGVFPQRVIRAFRYNRGRCEERLMDEHIAVDGPIGSVSGRIIDHSLKSLDWWTAKHNRYASLEAIEALNVRFGFLRPDDNSSSHSLDLRAKKKRFLKNNIYLRLPRGTRAFTYYIYRIIFRLGAMGSPEERSYHFLQGYWYRYLVDSKIAEVEAYSNKNKCSIKQAVDHLLSPPSQLD